jgi:tetratricopeptide (TPR) repeat protein
MKSSFLIRTALLLISLAGSSAFADASPEILLKEGRVDAAISALKPRTGSSSNDAEAYHLLSRAYFAVGRWDDAIKAGERAVALAGDRSDYHLWLGRAYGRKAEVCNPVFCAPGMARKMRTEFEKAVQLNGDDVHARTDLAEFYIEAPGLVGGGKDKAQREAEAIAKKDAASGHWVKARLAEKDKNYALAEQEYREALKASGYRADNWLSLASFYRRRGRLAEMEDAISKAVNGEKKPGNILFDAATLLYRAGRNFPQAAQFLGKYLSGKDKAEDAPAFEAHYLLGQIREKQGDKAGAAKEYEAALALARDYKQARDALNRLNR